jgi:hypothetical protein
MGVNQMNNIKLYKVYFGSEEAIRLFNTNIIIKKSDVTEEDWNLLLENLEDEK